MKLRINSRLECHKSNKITVEKTKNKTKTIFSDLCNAGGAAKFAA